MIAVVSRTDSPTAKDPHTRQWLRLKQYIFGSTGTKEISRGLLESLFDLLDSLLPQERVVRSVGITYERLNTFWNLDGERLDVTLNSEPTHSDERDVLSFSMKGLSACPAEQSQGKFSPVRVICESLQIQVEILHLIASTLRIVWKIMDWKDSLADKDPDFWHPQLGYLPRVLQRFYGSGRHDSTDRDLRQVVWNDRIQRLRATEFVSNDTLVDCLADQVCQKLNTEKLTC